MNMVSQLRSVTAFGDSVMKGVVFLNNSCENIPKYSLLNECFAKRCEQTLQIRIDNHSKFGSTIRYGMDAVKRFETDIEKADFAVFEYGGNDCDYNWVEIGNNPDGEHLPHTTLEDFSQMYCDIIDFVKGKGTMPVLLSLPAIDDVRFFRQVSRNANKENILKWLGGSTAHITNWHEVYNLEVFRLGREKHVPVIDITTPFLAKPNYRDYICEDGMHPNEMGHRLIAETVNRYIAQAKLALPHDEGKVN